MRARTTEVLASCVLILAAIIIGFVIVGVAVAVYLRVSW